MTDLPDLFPGFRSHRIALGDVEIFVRDGGDGPPLALIHGFPQTHVMWHRIAADLARHFTVVLIDLRGYGQSSAPESRGGEAYAKRVMARDIVAVMAKLGHGRFALLGHDRGARVSYRLALDHPETVTRIALLDIMPTVAMWDGMNAARAMQVYHWMYLAQPFPLPEMLLEKAARDYIDQKLASWTRDGSLAAFDERALAHYRAFFADPARIHACCEDYRAGATMDVDHDRADLAAGRTVPCPTLILWGGAGIPAASSSPLDVWRNTFAPHASGQQVDSGHFLPEENPLETLAALRPFLTSV